MLFSEYLSIITRDENHSRLMDSGQESMGFSDLIAGLDQTFTENGYSDDVALIFTELQDILRGIAEATALRIVTNGTITLHMNAAGDIITEPRRHLADYLMSSHDWALAVSCARRLERRIREEPHRPKEIREVTILD
jgi:hypothetical protein